MMCCDIMSLEHGECSFQNQVLMNTDRSPDLEASLLATILGFSSLRPFILCQLHVLLCGYDVIYSVIMLLYFFM